MSMRIIPFPSRRDGEALRALPAEHDRAAAESWLAELEDALSGVGSGPVADSWRELQADVRALAPPLDPAFESALRERLAARTPPAGGGRKHRFGRLLGSDPSWRRPALVLGVTLALVAPVVVVVIDAGTHEQAGRALFSRKGLTTRSGGAPATPHKQETRRGAEQQAATEGGQGGAAAGAQPQSAVSSESAVPSPSTSAPPSQGERLQELSASMTLTSTPTGVQELADRVSAVVIGDGGFVARSQVQQQSKGASEAQLTLRLPSAKLSSALAALGRLAPVASQSQSLQDITSGYDAASRRLDDARAERGALLRALARAQTQGEIESLHVRLAQARAAIARGAAEVKAVSRRAASAQVEVTVLGSQSSQGGGLTLHRGLHDVGRVLLVTLIVLAIGAVVLIPLGLLVFGLLAGRRAWLRQRRERVLSRS